MILCTRSDVPHQVETAGQGTGSIRCPATAGNARGNQTSTVGALFVGRAADWHLRRGSPAVDRGRPPSPPAPSTSIATAGSPTATATA